jgi:hypothetical protein
LERNRQGEFNNCVTHLTPSRTQVSSTEKGVAQRAPEQGGDTISRQRTSATYCAQPRGRASATVKYSHAAPRLRPCHPSSPNGRLRPPPPLIFSPLDSF